MNALLVFPHQLFVTKKEKTTLIFLEDAHFFDDGFNYHKHKLMLHRASMKSAFDALDCDKQYFEHPFDFQKLATLLKSYETVSAYDPINDALKQRYDVMDIVWMESPNFLTSVEMIQTFFKNKKRYYMKDFYAFQRKRLNVLMDAGKPLGGKYSFDADNRKKLPKGIEIPEQLEFEKTRYILDAAGWVDTNFKGNPGYTHTFNHPTTRDEACLQMHDFFTKKFSLFGPYQDAMSSKDPYLFHANISSSLNTGLLSPHEIIEEAMRHDGPVASKEGFIRQIIGWREFMRAVYVLEGQKMKTLNTLDHHHQLSDAWYKGTTHIPIIDDVIEKIQTYAYAHHIERLMVLGNVMMLSNIDPNEVYHYFMSMFIDAYEWVMVPNIYGMSQFASGDLMTTKPYFSGSNYLLKMGVSSGPWTETWDALFYRFVEDQRALIKKNPRLGILIKLLDKQSDEDKEKQKQIKAVFLSNITK